MNPIKLSPLEQQVWAACFGTKFAMGAPVSDCCREADNCVRELRFLRFSTRDNHERFGHQMPGDEL